MIPQHILDNEHISHEMIKNKVARDTKLAIRFLHDAGYITPELCRELGVTYISETFRWIGDRVVWLRVFNMDEAHHIAYMSGVRSCEICGKFCVSDSECQHCKSYNMTYQITSEASARMHARRLIAGRKLFRYMEELEDETWQAIDKS